MAIRFDDIGNRLKAFRLASGLSADQIAKRLDISRAALYRFEKGELAKIETLDKLAELLGVSVPTLLGVGVEYLPSAVAYFERLRQLEETASHIIVLAGPISYLLSSDAFHDRLAQVLSESIPDKVDNRKRALTDVERIMAILRERKSQYRARRPAIVNLIAASEIERFLANGLAGPVEERAFLAFYLDGGRISVFPAASLAEDASRGADAEPVSPRRASERARGRGHAHLRARGARAAPQSGRRDVAARP